MAILARTNFSGKKEPMTFISSLKEELVLFLEASNRDEAIDQIIDQLDRQGKLPNRLAFRDAIFKREELVSTGIGMGVAVPHAKLNVFSEFSIAVAIQKEKGIDWKSLDGMPVRMIFMIAGPEDCQVEYLQILSQLTASIKSDTTRKALLKTEEPSEVLSLLGS